MPHPALVEFASFADLFSQPACHSERSRERSERKSKNPCHHRYSRATTLSLRVAQQGLVQPFLILMIEDAPLLSRLLRQGGDFDPHELMVPSQVLRPVPAKNAGTRTGQPIELRFIRKGRFEPPKPEDTLTPIFDIFRKGISFIS
jgi:hypothetical protein